MFREAHLRYKTDVVPVLVDTSWVFEEVRGVREILAFDSASGQSFTLLTDTEGREAIKLHDLAKNDALGSLFLRFGMSWIHLQKPDLTAFKEEVTRCFTEKRRRH